MDNSVRDGSPHQMVGDVVVLAFTSTHIVDMIASLKKKAKDEDDGKQKKACQKDLQIQVAIF